MASKYKKIMEWLCRDKLERLSTCPFCFQECQVEMLKNIPEGLVRHEGGKYPFWLYHQETEAPCIEGMVYDLSKFLPDKWGTETELIKYTSSLELNGMYICRPSCEECNSVMKIYVQLRRIRMTINKYIQGEKRKERLKSTIHESIDRMTIYERDQGVCYLCGQVVDPQNFHIDHVVPLAIGGTHTYDNLRVTHPSCNLHKYNKIIGN